MVNGQIPPKQQSCERFESNNEIVVKEVEPPNISESQTSADLNVCIYGLKKADPSICSACKRFAMRSGSCPLIDKAMK